MFESTRDCPFAHSKPPPDTLQSWDLQNSNFASDCMAERLGLTTALLRVACEDRMILRSKHARERSEALEREKEAKLQRPYESPTESPHCVPTEESAPSEREIKAAEAARQRLYGGGKAGDAEVSRFSGTLRIIAAVCNTYVSEEFVGERAFGRQTWSSSVPRVRSRRSPVDCCSRLKANILLWCCGSLPIPTLLLM